MGKTNIEWNAYYSPGLAKPDYKGPVDNGFTCPYCGLRMDSMAYYHPCAGSLAASLFKKPVEERE